MEKFDWEGLAREVALLICERMYWGSNHAEDKEIIGLARSIVALVSLKLPNPLEIASQKPHGALGGSCEDTKEPE